MISQNLHQDHQDALNFMTCNVIRYINTLTGVTLATLSSSTNESIADKNGRLTMKIDNLNLAKTDTVVEEEGLSHKVLCSRSDLQAWEHENPPFQLPKDLKQFYSVTNGMKLQWFVESLTTSDHHPQHDTKPISHDLVGCSRISPLQELSPLPVSALATIQNTKKINSSEIDTSIMQGFVLETIPGYGKVILLYGHHINESDYNINAAYGASLNQSSPLTDRKKEDAESNSLNSKRPTHNSEYPSSRITKRFRDPTIWFLNDRNHQWNYLTKDFSSYFRLLLVHLGIVGWQYFFVDGENHIESSTEKESDLDTNSLSVDSRCLYFMQRFAPERLVVDIANLGNINGRN